MPSGSFRQVHIKCPYYIYDNGKDRIQCEGVIPNTQLQSRFDTKADYDRQILSYCCASYWNCAICAANDNKYEEIE